MVGAGLGRLPDCVAVTDVIAADMLITDDPDGLTYDRDVRPVVAAIGGADENCVSVRMVGGHCTSRLSAGGGILSPTEKGAVWRLVSITGVALVPSVVGAPAT